jgi:multidrug efflux system membrane fusion protein
MMRLGMTASVALRVEGEAAAAVVPLAALTEGNGSPVVFVVDPGTKAVRIKPVIVGGIADDGVRIENGLQAGDMVVIAGVQFLRDGMRVRLLGHRQDSRLARAPE